MRFVCLIALILFSVPAYAQMTGPFIEGDSVSPYPSTVRCFNHKGFAEFIRARNFRIVMLAAGTDNPAISKIILTNDDDVMVANIIPDNRACVLDIFEKTYFTNDFVFKEKKKQEQDD
jgi:hypothetical protein